ncbi:MAG: trehalose-6-phosphate synthase [Candidatus Omnitrophica bacterium]|nr:trehalose-6-phosphate synthase [Candidatus Omnitrophota bacterium]
MWTQESLGQLIREKMQDYLFVVVSNREPYSHIFNKGRVECHRGIGGVASALDPVMQVCHGTWVAQASGDADYKVVDKMGRVKVPPEKPFYTLKRVWLSKEEENGYYFGFSNEALWPLCHMAFQRPVFRKNDWEYYKIVNEKFSKAILDEIGDRKAFVWIQDYQLCLLPKFLKERAPNQLIIAHFWHIPWLGYESFRICPQKKEILEGLLASDLLGFHLRYHCDNFVDTVDREIESKIDRERFSIIRAEHETIIRPYPISVDFEGIHSTASLEEVEKIRQLFVQEFDLSGRRVLLGIDRLDYTKGIPERLKAIDFMFNQYPELKEKVVFLQIGQPTRLHIPIYKSLNDEINTLVEEINWKYSTRDWKPVIFSRHYVSLKEAEALYRLADVCIVSSLHDGMNLVAKEYISSCPDEKGMLVLSQFAGAAKELTDAVLVNPFDLEQFSKSIVSALIMPEEDRRKRMDKMKEIVRQNNIFRWAGKILSELLKLEFKE